MLTVEDAIALIDRQLRWFALQDGTHTKALRALAALDVLKADLSALPVKPEEAVQPTRKRRKSHQGEG
jgi:hypothetical protein